MGLLYIIFLCCPRLRALYVLWLSVIAFDPFVMCHLLQLSAAPDEFPTEK